MKAKNNNLTYLWIGVIMQLIPMFGFVLYFILTLDVALSSLMSIGIGLFVLLYELTASMLIFRGMRR